MPSASQNKTGIALRAQCEIHFEVAEPTPLIFMLRPRSMPGQWITREEYRVLPASVQVTEYSDYFGNLCQRLVAPVGDFLVHTTADVLVSMQQLAPMDTPFVNIPDLPDSVLHYLLPSRYCESDRFNEMALDIVGNHLSVSVQVKAITDWVRRHVKYSVGSSTYPVSAIEVNMRREGVCRDLAHMCIALCRALCIPARLVVGYLYQLVPMDIHAWFEVYINGQWYTFDPTEQSLPKPRIAIAHGQDASDVAIYNQYGPMLLPTDMQVTVEQLV